MVVLGTNRVANPRPDHAIGSPILSRQDADRSTDDPDTSGQYHRLAHPGDTRLSLPPGVTTVNFETGVVYWVEDEDGNAQDETLRSDVPTVDNFAQIEDDHVPTLRSLGLFSDITVEVTVGGSTFRTDPCVYFSLPSTDFTVASFFCPLPTDIYFAVSSRTQGFSDMSGVSLHADRTGGFNAQPTNDTWETTLWTGIGLADGSGVQDADAKAAGPLHVQNYPIRTFVVDNVDGANSLEYRIQGKAGHRGSGRWVVIDPATFPITVGPGDQSIHENVQSAWHELRLQVNNVNVGETVNAEYDMSATNF